MNLKSKMKLMEYKLNDRFIITFPEDVDLKSWVVTKIDMPKYNNGWEEMRIEFLNQIGPSTSQALYKMINSNYKNVIEFTIDLLDPVGVIIEKWEIKTNHLKYNFGTLEYKNNNPQIIELVVSPEYCKLIY